MQAQALRTETNQVILVVKDNVVVLTSQSGCLDCSTKLTVGTNVTQGWTRLHHIPTVRRFGGL